jgi:hypothetical protein
MFLQSWVNEGRNSSEEIKEEQERGARKAYKRLSLRFKVTNTSLDHLLLGTAADGGIIGHSPAVEQILCSKGRPQVP